MGCHCLRDKEPLSLPSKGHSAHQDKESSPKIATSSQEQATGETHTSRKRRLALPEGHNRPGRSSEHTPVRSPSELNQATPRGRKEQSLVVKLRDVRVISEGLESYYRVKAADDGGLIGAEVKDTKKKCWVRTYALSPLRKVKDKRAKLAVKMRQLDHPHVLRVLDVLQSQEQQFLVYEAAEGGTAQEWCKRIGGLNEYCAATIMRQVFLAVRHCHSKGIVLGEVTLSQIVFAEPPTEQCIWVKLLVSLEDQLDLASDSPEMQKKLVLTHANVIFKCGEVLSRLLTGESVLTGWHKSAHSEEFKSSYMKWQSVSPEVKNFTMSLLSRDPAKRPTLQECLQHPWVAESRCKPALSPCLRSAIRNLATVSPVSSLKKTLLQVIFNLVLSYDDLKEARKAFLELDLDTDGTVSELELQEQINRLFPEEQAQAALTAITSTVVFSEQRTISYSEFLLWACGPALLTSVNINNAFHLMDTYSDGKMTSKHLRDFCTFEQEDNSDILAWRKLVTSISKSMDGTFHYKDFCVFLQK